MAAKRSSPAVRPLRGRPKQAAARKRPVRMQLLHEATRLFAARGFDGVTVDEVVAAAKVNKRMVYHYFGSKDGLYMAVLERAYTGLRQSEEGMFPPAIWTEPTPAILANVVATYFRFFMTHADVGRILLWENLQGGSHLRRVTPAISKSPMLAPLQRLVRQGEADGSLRSGIDPQHLLVNLFGLCQIYFSNRHTMSHAIDLDLTDPAVLEKGIEQATAVAIAGLCPPGPDRGRR